MRRKKMALLGKNKIIVIILVFCFIAGFILGLATGFVTDTNYISYYVNSYFYSFQNSPNSFLESFFKYAKYVLGIWFLAFVKIGMIFVFLIILFKGIGLGFTVAVLYKNFKSVGLLAVSLMSIPQHIILIPTYILTGFFSINFCTRNFQDKNNNNLDKYILILIIGIVISVFASSIDFFVIPEAIKKII